MSLHGSMLASARFRMWLRHPSGPEVNSGCVGWTNIPLPIRSRIGYGVSCLRRWPNRSVASIGAGVS